MKVFGSPDPPKVEPPAPPPDAAPTDDADALARQRRSLNARRRGTQALRIDPNPGVIASQQQTPSTGARTNTSGLSIL